MTPLDLRGLLPALKNTVWLNAAASSPVPLPVAEAMKAHVDETVATGDRHYPTWAKKKEEVRARLARFIGADAAELAFTPSTSFGFHVIGQLLKARGVTEVLTLEHEFPSTTLPLLYGGLTLRGVRAQGGTYPLHAIEAALTAKTGAIAVSAVQFASGYRVDLEGVAALCRARGLSLAINAAQGLGHVPLDVHALGADFLAATSHKWFMAGYGVGSLYVAKRVLDETPLPLGGWLSVKPEEQFQTWANAARTDDAAGFTATGLVIRRDASALEVGGGSWLGLYAVDAALALHEKLGIADTLARNIHLNLRLREGLRRRGFAPNTPDTPQTMSGICVVPVQGNPADVVRTLLHDAGIASTARGAGVRLSTHVYNTEEDVDRLLAAVDELGIKPG
jgi:selenocysteine lyase/cysteine desulfurase